MNLALFVLCSTLETLLWKGEKNNLWHLKTLLLWMHLSWFLPLRVLTLALSLKNRWWGFLILSSWSSSLFYFKFLFLASWKATCKVGNITVCNNIGRVEVDGILFWVWFRLGPSGKALVYYWWIQYACVENTGSIGKEIFVVGSTWIELILFTFLPVLVPGPFGLISGCLICGNGFVLLDLTTCGANHFN